MADPTGKPVEKPADDDWITVPPATPAPAAPAAAGDWSDVPASATPYGGSAPDNASQALPAPAGDPLSRAAQGLWSNTGGALTNAAKALWDLKSVAEGKKLPDPETMQIWNNIVKAHQDEAQQAKDAWGKGNHVEAAGHALATALPLVGPAAAHAAERMSGFTPPVYDKYGNVVTPGQAPDVAGGAGEAAGLLLPAAAGAAFEGARAVIPSATRAAASIEDVTQAAGHLPVDVTAPGDIALKAQRLAQSGGVMPKVIQDFLNRITAPNQPPLTFGEARDFYTNASRLSADEFNKLTPPMKRTVGDFRTSLDSSLADTAGKAGMADQYRAALTEYRRAMAKQAVQSELKSVAKSSIGKGIGIGAGTTALGWLYNKLWGGKAEGGLITHRNPSREAVLASLREPRRYADGGVADDEIQLGARPGQFTAPTRPLKLPAAPPRFEDPVAGYLGRSADQMSQGWQDLWQPSDTTAADPEWWNRKAQAASDVVRGATPFAAPLAIPAAAAAPVSALTGLAGGLGAAAGTQALAEKAGVPPGQAALASDVTGLAGGLLGPEIAPDVAKAAVQAPSQIQDLINQLEYTGGDPERGSISRRPVRDDWLPGMKLADIPENPAVPQQGKKLLTEDVARYLEGQVQRKMGSIPADAPQDQKLNRILQLGRGEIEDQLAKPPEESGVNWYSLDTQRADRNLARVFPELATDPTKNTIQKSISAVMSNNSTPKAEANYGAQIYDLYRQSGSIPPTQPNGKAWPAQGATPALAKIDNMIQTLGEQGYADFINHPQTVANIRQFRPGAEGKASDIVPGSVVLGPKIGRYFMDVMGMPQEGSTVDRWDVRGQQRRMGRMFNNAGDIIEAPSPESDRPIFMQQHKQLGDEYGLTRNQAQSALWHYEQELYRRMGLDVKSFKRSDGIGDFLGTKGLTLEP